MSATKPATNGAPYTVPPEPNRVPAILLAVAAHAVLLAFLWVGISWEKNEPPAVEAEVWDTKVQSAAAPALPPPPPPPEVAEPEPRPEPTPPPPTPKVAEPEPVKPAAPDINLEREKKLAEQKKQRELEEKKERELAEKRELAELKKKELEKKELDKKLAEKKELEKKELDKKAQEKKLADAKLEADKKKVAAEKAAKAKAEAADQAKLDKMRDEELKRITGAAGTSGSAQKSTAPKIDAGYVGRLTGIIKSNTNFTGSTDVPGNPKAVFKVEQLPTGEILSVRLTKSSGVPQFDEAVERGINKSSPLPKKKDGTVERTLVVNFSMKDLD
ncbi:cell envelope integrity protein TolA [Massilia niabensis]|uniref:Cell envelope integrity protein TolA n=1 Tax=Massilia niabensis TaxID=544910 RepID=A0ABW0L3S7_9BURK